MDAEYQPEGDRFVLLERVGQGGMGAVYRATDTATGERVAIKVMLGVATSEAVERFEREARLLAKLNHPGVVGFRHTGRMRSGEAFLVMEWLEGEDVAARLEREPFRPLEAVQLTRGAAEALSALHELGLVHRDVKPQNLFLVGGRADRVKVLDFGIARSQATLATLTNPGTAIGTPAYMAPEQALADRRIDARADLFSLGCVLFECLSGTPPFVGESAVACLANVLLTDPPALATVAPGLPSALEELCHRMMAKEPQGRPESAALVAKELSALEPLLDTATAGAVTSGRKLSLAEKRVATILIARAPASSPTLERDMTIALASIEQDLERHREAVARHGARVTILADGTLLGLFAGSESSSDLARHAAAAALALRVVAPERALALATDLATLSGNTATGAAVSRAFALATTEGKIRLDVTTRGLLGSSHVIRGIAGGTELVSVAATRQTTSEDRVLHGRARELRLLESAMLSLPEESQARVVLVVGAAGLGKSTLLGTALKEAERKTFLRHVTAFADPVETEVPLAVLTHLVRALLGVQHNEDRATSRKKFHASLRALRAGTRPARAPFIEHALSLTEEVDVEVAEALLDPRVFTERFITEVSQLAREIAATGPLVLAVEDLHACDAASLRALERLLGDLVEAPLLVLATARPELDQVFPRAFAERALERIHLLPLPKKAALQFARAHAARDLAADDALLERVVARSGGNPLFLLELLRSASEGDASETEGPSTVVALLQERLGRLETNARRVLRAASVFGAVFWRSGVLGLIGEEEALELAQWLDELVRKDFLTETGATRAGGDAEYAFRHALVRDAVYATLTDGDLAVAHNLAARFLEAQPGAEPLAVARHFELAGRTSRAAPHWARAAAIAFERGECARALELAARIDALDDRGDTDLASLDLTVAHALFWSGDTKRAVDRARRAARATSEGSPLWLAAQSVHLKVIAMEYPEELEELLTPLLDRLETTSLPRPVGAVADVVAGLLRSGRGALAKRALAVLSQGGDGLLHTGHRLRAESWLQMYAGDLAACIDLDRRSAEAYEAAGALGEAAVARCATAYGHLSVGNYPLAKDLYEREVTRCRRDGRDFVLYTALHNLSFAEMRLGDVERSLTLQHEALALIDEQRPVARLFSKLYLGLAHAERGDVAEARSSLGEILEEASPSTSRALAAAALSGVELREGNVEAALALARRAFEDRARLGENLEEGDALLFVALGRALEAAGHEDEAAELLTRGRADLVARAGRISDERLRASFLEAVPENAALMRTSPASTTR